MKTLHIKVKPNARTQHIAGPDSEGIWHIQIKSPPVDGKANEELIHMLALQFGCKKADITIKRGANARIKAVVIDME